MKFKTMDQIYQEEIILRLKFFGGRKNKVAASLGISYNTLYTKIRKHGLTYLIKDVNSPIRKRPFRDAMRALKPEPIPMLPTGERTLNDKDPEKTEE